ncbi:MAG: A/G-specific adenine glycosylase [Fimbriimonadaceae bacterium]
MIERRTLAEDLIEWWQSAQRNLPWREDRTAYPVLVSEFMLQQTRIESVLPYFHRWMICFPSLQNLAVADESEVMAAWQGLGYYSRARNLHSCAKWICENGWPAEKEEWRKLPGIGDYTASALSAALLGADEVAVDGNLARVYARLQTVESTGEPLRRAAKHWLSEQREGVDADTWNQMLMDFGATVCKPTGPLCGTCAVQSQCIARKLNAVSRYPTRPAKAKRRTIHGEIYLLKRDDTVGLHKIEDGKWWRGLWVLPFHLHEELASGEALASPVLGQVRATVTKHLLLLDVIVPEEDHFSWGEPERWVPLSEVHTVAMPAPFRKVLKQFA